MATTGAAPSITRAVAEDPGALAAAHEIAAKHAAEREAAEANNPTGTVNAASPELLAHPKKFTVKIIQALGVKAPAPEDRGDHQLYVVLRQGAQKFISLHKDRKDGVDVPFNETFEIIVGGTESLNGIAVDHNQSTHAVKTHKEPTAAEKAQAEKGKKHEHQEKVHPADPTLTVELFDKDTYGVEDKSFGKAKFDLSKATEQPQDVELQLHHALHRHIPKVHLQISLAGTV
ncbi:uncharacterized protein EV422DRAFT_536323 [Fimicolochytrium jonesii]|uniref:uncharacterized protein n=1 Tax=Fimicolochytrium jonesii TaxID=1396493 RepID=UPI0022FF4048|nr:uncharacterized protein EV422DRAFT_536323 [Fimicolochytrium jonesii]KAI8819013.1 hypothetical protein EV422DRAFT_536323 [Fimicolochytrium jonesii]